MTPAVPAPDEADEHRRYAGIGEGNGWRCPACWGDKRPDQLPNQLRLAHDGHMEKRRQRDAAALTEGLNYISNRRII